MLSLTGTVICGCGLSSASARQQHQVTQGAEVPADSVALVFDSVHVVDVQAARVSAARRVVVMGNRIRAVGRVDKIGLPRGARVIDGRGKYLIPGLWDMHVHVYAPRAANFLYPLFLANGVTGIREMAQPLGLDSLHQWRREIASGVRVGPRIVGTGPLVEADDAGSTVYTRQVTSPDAARRVVDSLKSAGADFIKIHSGTMSRAVYFALLAEARRVKLPVAGHLPASVTAMEASDSGQRSIEHFLLDVNALADVQHNKLPSPCWQSDTVSERACATQAARFAKNGTWFTPTLAILLSENSELWRALKAGRPFRAPGEWPFPRDSVGGQQTINEGLWFVRAAGRAGLPLLAGTDFLATSDVRRWPSVQHELALFVEAGLTPAEALRTATLHPAKYLDATDSLGTVEPGKLADLVLLDANPLRDIHGTMKIRAVVANGRFFDRAALDALLAGVDEVERAEPAQKRPGQ